MKTRRGSLNHRAGYSETAQCTGKPSYLERIRNSMQKPIEGLLAAKTPAFNKREGATITEYNSSINLTKPEPTRHRQPTLTTLIPPDDTLILTETASKTVRQHTNSHQKHATPQPHGCGVKGEPNRKQSGTQNDTTHRQQKATHTKTYEKCFTKRQTNTTKRPDMPRRLENGSA